MSITDSVWCMDRVQVIDIMEKLSIGHDDDCDGNLNCACDEDVLRSMVYSFCASVPDTDRLLEIADNFGESFELVQALLESSSGRLTQDIVTQLTEEKSVPFVSLTASRHGDITASLPIEVDCRSTLVVCEESVDDNKDAILVINEETSLVSAVQLSQPSVHSSLYTGLQSVRSRLPFGVSDLSITLRRTVVSQDNSTCSQVQTLRHEQRVLVTSPVFRFAGALDAMFDRLFFGWEGHWSDALEAALFELLVAVDDDLVAMVRSWVAMLGAMGTGADDMHHMLQCVTLDVQNALNNHSAQAVGRLHQTLVQFTDTSSMSVSMMRVPEVFVRATNAFMQAKLDASEMGNMKRDLEKLIHAADEYLQELNTNTSVMNASTAHRTKQNVASFLQCARACIDSYTTSTTSTTVTNTITTTTLVTLELAQLIQNLKPQGMEMITHSSITAWDCTKIDSMPYLPLECVTDPALLHRSLRRLSETLVMDAFNLGGVMGYTIGEGNVAQSAALIGCLLREGAAYVTSEGGKLMGLLPMERSMLLLNDPRNTSGTSSSNGVWTDIPTSSADSTTTGSANHTSIPFIIPTQLRKRAKDMQRVFRNNVKRTLSLRLNSDVDLAVQKLRLHHGSDCWVGPALQSVWKCMASTSPPQLLIFELWYGDEMIAADYAHPVCGGRSVYVATRFYDRSAQLRNLAPGFLLALVVTKYLQQLGCNVWDLGTSNLCPLMRYKLDLTGEPYSRPNAQYELLRAHNTENSVDRTAEVAADSVDSIKNMSTLRAGVLIENITIADLLS